ncbi:Zinc finger CCCH domain-containing protein 48 [Abeliophyllum distichum]|uniref:Zinc finger CCCH domain-containing protein 48 n=1 Tax=Abeliophyllum distichum TaxID=126358 RepID=A0ABD1PA19_9LAMI
MNGHLPAPPQTVDCRTGSEFSLTRTAGWRCRKMVRVPGSYNLLLVTMGGQMKSQEIQRLGLHQSKGRDQSHITMDVKAARRISVFKRLEGGQPVRNKVWAYWLAGRCNQGPCKFMHRESPTLQTKQTHSASHEESGRLQSSKRSWRNPNYDYLKNGTVLTDRRARSKLTIDEGDQPEVQVGRESDCMDQEMVIISTGSIHSQQALRKTVTAEGVRSCKDVHSWFCGSGFTLLMKLEGNIKTITGIALPSGSDKLYSGSKDKSIRIWDCNSGQCAGAVDLDGEVGCLISEGPWLFVGLPNAIKAWNLQAQTELSLSEPVGQIYSMVMYNDMLFAGVEGGTILAWKFHTETNIPELAAMLKGHSGVVCSLVVGANRLYSGSSDSTIRMWDLETLQCMQTLHGHTRDVTSVIFWDSYLLSASLDNTLKVWAATESGNLEVVYELKKECPVLLCSYNDNTVRLYDLPSFFERGRIFTMREVQVIQIDIGGLFFTGDATGQLSVWKLLGVATAS